jgi:phosphatidylserine/phosphatidylglycerophosphate/cardiolipin synthase-like enzyme
VLVMAKFVTTSGINYLIEEIIKGAKERLVLVSPYLRLNDRIKELLSSGYRPDVDIEMVYGKRELDAPERQWLNSVPHVQTRFCQNLHAKCYLNESLCVVTSLNLYEFSQQNNNEMGVMIKRANDHQLYADVAAEVDRLLRISESTLGDRQNLVLEPPEFDKLTTAKLAKERGLDTRTLQSKLCAIGYLEIREGGKPYLTSEGKKAGGEFRFGKGPYFVWPVDVQL